MNYEQSIFQCPHQKPCPRAMDSADNTPCNFQSAYYPLRVGEPQNIDMTTYSYLILKRGLRTDEDASIEWPRLVRPTLVRSRHTICRMCTHQGKLEEVVVTASKHSK